MNEKYGGLVSNPRNTKDTQVVKSITYTTSGTVVETVNLNAWPAATENDTSTPTPTPTQLTPFSSDDMVLITDSESQYYNQKVGTKIVDGERKVIVCGFKGDPTPLNDECIVALVNTDGRLYFESYQVQNENVQTYEELLEVVSGYFNLPVYEYGYYDGYTEAYRQIESICSNFDNILFYGYPGNTSNGRWLVRILNGEMCLINWQNITNVGIKRINSKFTGNTNMPTGFRQLSPDHIEVTNELNFSITIGSDTVTFVDGSPSVHLTQWC